MAENILIDGEKLFCLPGGTKALVAALDKKTGKTIWINNDFTDVAAYCSPIIVDYKGVRQLITVSQKTVLCLDVETGKLLWSHPHVTKHDQNVNRPLFKDGHVLVASGHLGGCVLLKINPDLKGVTEVWANKKLDNCHGGVMLLDGYLYGSSCRSGGKAFFCADFLTGETTQTERAIRKTSLTYADGRLYGINDRGEMMLFEIEPGKFKIVSRFRLPRGDGGIYLAHPTICGGRLYIRHGKNLYAYDVKAR